ncbi:hypothetical protein CCHR01_03171 [Colletotrichum chrysophilum]|uniref:Uncharacterized protein n=1 Tax=Colletotrichum chrysophilum TaxID=1836956 RepID=A0AAD9AVP8_9PEZI|nr:hypothetical protein CCHR01_03171 [Colletotrichum chrysophilum]
MVVKKPLKQKLSSGGGSCRRRRLRIRLHRVDLVKDLLCASVHQVLCHKLAKVIRLLSRLNRLGPLRVHPLLAVDVHHRRLHPQLLGPSLGLHPARLHANRHTAPSLERAHHAALCHARQHGRFVLILLQQLQHPLVVRPRLDADGALSDGVQDATALRLEVLRDARAVVHAQQARGREDDGGEGALGVVALAQAGLNVAAHVGELEARVAALQLGDAADAAGANDAAVGEVGDGLPAVLLGEAGLEDDDVARVLALGDAAEDAAVGQGGGHVLERVDDDVDLLRHEFGLELVGPQALAAKVVQRRDLILVAERLHAVDLELLLGAQRGEAVDDDVGLLHGQRRLARADVDGGAVVGHGCW